MKKIIFNLLIINILIFTPCCNKNKTAEVQKTSKRAVTIINNTGNAIKGFQIKAGKDGPEIEKGGFSANQEPVYISDSWSNSLELEVVLVDQYDNIYSKIVEAPLKGNTNISISKDDRVNLPGNILRDLVEWFNKNK